MASAPQPVIQLLTPSGALTTGAWFPWLGILGRFTVDCNNLNNATVRLEVLGPGGLNGVPYDPAGVTNVTFTGSGQVLLTGGFFMDPGSQVRAGIIGTPGAPVFASINTLPAIAAA